MTSTVIPSEPTSTTTSNASITGSSPLCSCTIVLGVASGGQLGEHLTHPRLAGVQNHLHRRIELVDAVALDEFDERAQAGTARTCLARTSWSIPAAGVGEHRPIQILVSDARPVKLHPRIDDPLLEDVGGVADERCERGDIEVVGLDPRIGDDLAVEEARDQHRDVPLMGASEIRIVHNDHIAVIEPAAGRVVLDDRLEAQIEAADEHRQRLDLEEHAEMAVVKRSAAVEDVVDDWRERRPF